MAYSDYGGYAYLNGIHIAERSDTSIKIDSTTEIDGHVVLGDGPIYIVLYKQYAIIYSGGEQLKTFSYPLDITDDHIINEFLNIHHHNISIYLTYEDNYYVYAKLAPSGSFHTYSLLNCRLQLLSIHSYLEQTACSFL